LNFQINASANLVSILIQVSEVLRYRFDQSSTEPGN
jgi:hypothetical protein